MIFNFIRARLGLLLFSLALIALARVSRADEGDSPDVEAQRLIHILGYIATDYGGAVVAGAVVNQAEYDEQLTLLSDAEKITQRLKADPRVGPELAPEVARVGALVQAKADGAEISAAVAGVRAQITSAFKLIDAPAAALDEARGRSLYVEHCATCHGQTGRADTARAASLSPRPVNFHDVQVGPEMTPARVARTVRFGINGTSMVPFTFLSDAERWDLGFYATSLRHGAATLTAEIEAPAYTLG
jgi:high-affinity iron transporter